MEKTEELQKEREVAVGLLTVVNAAAERQRLYVDAIDGMLLAVGAYWRAKAAAEEAGERLRYVAERAAGRIPCQATA